MNQPHDSSATLVVDKISRTLHRFLHVEAVSGVVLLLAACIALLWANSPWAASYEHFWHTPISFSFGEWSSTHSLHFWINDGLMTIFFLVVGLEIRRELHEGALSSVRLALLPAIAAFGGVCIPALVYLSIAPQVPQGWAVPTATDIAFALGVLALLGKRVPGTLRVFLLAIAIIDDIAAILIIALVYSSGIQPTGLLISGLALLGVWVWRWLGIRTAWAYVLPGFALWYGLLSAGLHPTLSGVLLGLLTPVRTQGDDGSALRSAAGALKEFGARLVGHGADGPALMAPLQDLQRAQLQLLAPALRVQVLLHPWVAFGVMPLFALANAGVRLPAGSVADLLDQPLVLAVGLGLLVGKPIGIIATSVIAKRLRLGEFPTGVDWRGLLLVGCLGGIGFTMSIFISTLAFAQPAMLAAAKLGILIASASAAVVGLALGAILLRSKQVVT